MGCDLYFKLIYLRFIQRTTVALMTSHSPLLSHSHIRLRSLLASLALASWLGRGWSPAPHHDTPVRSERGWSHAPGGSVCRAAAGAAARSRSQPHLTLLASPRLARLASLASPRLPSTRLARLALLRPHLGFLLDSPCLARLASPLHSLASPPRSPHLLARLASLRSSAAAPLATSSLASLVFCVVNLRRSKPSAFCGL